MLSIRRIYKGRSAINQKNQKGEEMQCNKSKESIEGKVQSIKRDRCNQLEKSKGGEEQCNQKNQKGEKCNAIGQNNQQSRGERSAIQSIRRINSGRSAINQKNQKGEKCNAINLKNQ